LVFNTTPQMLTAALAGHGLAYVPEDAIARHVDAGELVTVLEDWCPAIPGYHLYHPSRRQSSPAFQLVVDTLRYPHDGDVTKTDRAAPHCLLCLVSQRRHDERPAELRAIELLEAAALAVQAQPVHGFLEALADQVGPHALTRMRVPNALS
jgi:hypothetical protein